jgi:iron complex transport system substrate-binding protein
VLLWDPDILIVTDPKDVTLVGSDPVLRQLKAVKRGQVHVVPVGAHTWSNRTAEQPLTVLWAAKTFHPARFPALDLARRLETLAPMIAIFEVSPVCSTHQSRALNKRSRC